MAGAGARRGRPRSASPPPQQQQQQTRWTRRQMMRRDSTLFDSQLPAGAAADHGVFGTPLFPLLVHYGIMYVVLLLFKVSDLAPQISVLNSLFYWVTAFMTLEISRIIYVVDPLSLRPLFLSFGPFCALIVVSREAYSYLAGIWFMFLLLVNMRRGRHRAYNLGRTFVVVTVLFAAVFVVCSGIMSLHYVGEPDNTNPLLAPKLRFNAVKPSMIITTIVLAALIAAAFYAIEMNVDQMRRGEAMLVAKSSPQMGPHELSPTEPSTLRSLFGSFNVDSLRRRFSAVNGASPPRLKAGALARSDTASPLPRFEIPYEELQIGKRIGQGASGSVFVGMYNGQRVAIKKLISNTSIMEAELLSQLSHRHVVRFYGACTDPTNMCIVMEYAERGCLYDLLHNASFSMTPGLVLDWARQIASGMEYLHRGAPRQIVHRDLKSNNILVADNGDLKITDFGVSRELGHETKMTMAGTYGWMAPEMIRNEASSEKVDVWSYGVVVWELLTREIPFNGMPQVAIAFRVGNGTLKLPTNLQGMPVVMCQLMSSCFELEASKRPSFTEILRLLLDVSSSPFASQPGNEFKQRQHGWQERIQQFVSRENSEQMSTRERMLLEKEKDVQRREQNVRRRENQLIRKSTKPIPGMPIMQRTATTSSSGSSLASSSSGALSPGPR